jgi:lipopolysaccharide transport system permease protein
LNVEFRDVRYVIPFLIQFWMFATPVAYPGSLIQGIWRTAYGINPMVTVMDGFRWAVLSAAAPPAGATVLSIITSIALLISGAFYFRRMERGFADVV